MERRDSRSGSLKWSRGGSPWNGSGQRTWKDGSQPFQAASEPGGWQLLFPRSTTTSRYPRSPLFSVHLLAAVDKVTTPSSWKHFLPWCLTAPHPQALGLHLPQAPHWPLLASFGGSLIRPPKWMCPDSVLRLLLCTLALDVPIPGFQCSPYPPVSRSAPHVSTLLLDSKHLDPKASLMFPLKGLTGISALTRRKQKSCFPLPKCLLLLVLLLGTGDSILLVPQIMYKLLSFFVFPRHMEVPRLGGPLDHSHSNAGSEPRLRPTQLMAVPDP